MKYKIKLGWQLVIFLLMLLFAMIAESLFELLIKN
jgi:hypothetical protein